MCVLFNIIMIMRSSTRKLLIVKGFAFYPQAERLLISS